MIAVITFFVSCSKEEPLTATVEIQKPKNSSSKAGFTPKGNLIIENNSSFIFDFYLQCSVGTDANFNYNSTTNNIISNKLSLGQNQIIDAFTVTTFEDFATNGNSTMDWTLFDLTNSTSTNIPYQFANFSYGMSSGNGNYYTAWGAFKGNLYGNITDPDDPNNVEVLSSQRIACLLSEYAVNNGSFGWEIPELYFSVNFVNYTKLKLILTAEVLANGDTVLNIKQILY